MKEERKEYPGVCSSSAMAPTALIAAVSGHAHGAERAEVGRNLQSGVRDFLKALYLPCEA